MRFGRMKPCRSVGRIGRALEVVASRKQLLISVDILCGNRGGTRGGAGFIHDVILHVHAAFNVILA